MPQSGGHCRSEWSQSFSYDPFGNVKKTNNGGATAYSANYSTATNQVSSGISPAPLYDQNGNQKNLTASSGSLTWNALNQPITFNTSTSATYDALGRMVETYNSSSGVAQQFVFRPSGAMLAVYNAGTGTLVKGTVPLPGGETAIYNSSGLNYIRHSDWLGSSRFSTTWAHAVYAKESYAPFGETYNEAGTADRSFTGQDQDVISGSGGTGVYDFPYRKYDPSAGRWLSPDPSGWNAVNLANPQTLNRYAYVVNNPLALADPNGLDCAYQNEDGSVHIDPNDCPTDANGNPTDNGFYIDASGVTDAQFDDDGNLAGYSIGAQQFDIYGSPYTPTLIQVDASGAGTSGDDTFTTIDLLPDSQQSGGVPADGDDPPCTVGNCTYVIHKTVHTPPGNACLDIHRANGKPSTFVSLWDCIGKNDECEKNRSFYQESCSSAGNTPTQCRISCAPFAGTGCTFTCQCCDNR